jgi:hypothetical protein
MGHLGAKKTAGNENCYCQIFLTQRLKARLKDAKEAK